MRLWFFAGSAMAGVLLISGCASTSPRDNGFGDVQAMLADRGVAQRVQWNTSSEADASATAAVRELLARELTADDAVQVALLNNRRLQATYEELGIAQADLVQAGLLANPVFEFDPRWATKSGFEFSYELTVVQDFLNVLLLPLRKRVAQSQFEAAKLGVADVVLGTAAEVKSTFYKLQGAEQLVEMRRTVVSATEASSDAARRLHEAGNITDLALTNEQALHEQAKLDLAGAEADALELREELNVLLGLWGPDTQWRPAARLAELPPQEVGPQGLESLAVARRLDLAAARQELRGLIRALDLAGYGRIPFSLGVHSESEPDPDGPTTIGPHLELSLPLFDQGQATVAAAQARVRQSQQRFTALAVEIRAQVRRLWGRMMAQRARAHYYRTIVLPLRHRALEETQLQYNAMQIGAFQLLSAKQAEIDAGRDYVESLRDYWVARAELERAAGGSLAAGTAATLPTTQPAASSTRPEESGPRQSPPHHEHHGKGHQTE